MGASSVLLLSLIRFSALLASIQGALATTATPFLTPGFHFQYDNGQQQHTSVPVTAQCDRINLMWTRDTDDIGTPPIAPYFFQVYTSTSETPYVVYAGFGPTFAWDVPFAPNTQYQICMFDSNGVSGGCHATYTVITNTTVTNPTCQNVTAPSELSVSGTVPLGPFARHSHVDQCSSLSVTPQSGSPPFTLTIAPSSHPPYNLTSNTKDPISWLVSLPVGYHFFMALSSSDGLLWGSGPIQVGGSGPTGCLAPGTISLKEAISIIVGTSIGGTALGIAIGIWFYAFYTRRRRRRQRSPSQNYFASQYFSSTKPYKAPTLVPSTISPLTSVAGHEATYQPYQPYQPMSTVNDASSITDAPQVTRSYSYSPSLPTLSDSTSPFTPRTTRELTEVPLEPLRPNRQSRLPLPEPSSVAHSDSSPTQNQFPPDVKIRLQPSNISDDASLTSSSSNVRHPPSNLTRSPTYSPHPSTIRQPVYVIDETEVTDVPPEYGRHMADTSCTPSIISSGRIPSGRF